MNANRFKSTIVGIWLVFMLCTAGSGCNRAGAIVADHPGNLITSWNELVFEIAIAEDGLMTLKGLRTASMMHAAIHDAINSVRSVYSPYAYKSEADAADPVSAAATAAYEIAVSQYPNQQKTLQQELENWRSSGAAGRPGELGIALGKVAAAEVLNVRKGDGWDGEAEYTWHPMGPGVYAEFHEHSGTPEGFVFGAGWAAARPFFLPAPDHFRSPAPPDIDSEAYAQAFDEVRELGRTESSSRTADQTHLAMWWKDFVENSHNRLARELTLSRKLNLWEAARAFALLNMSIYDAYISSFDNKFHYNHWRPYTAIRWAKNDGNPRTQADPQWNNLHLHTYAFPSYPSAHGTASAAAMRVLAEVFGNDLEFTMTIAEVDSAGPFSGKLKMDPPTRSFSSFSEAALECAMSRLYLGIHFRYDSVAGNTLGTQIGTYACDRFYKPVE